MPAACDPVLEDIEDIVSAADFQAPRGQLGRRNVFPKVRKRSSQRHLQGDDDPPSDSIIPGAQKIWIRTWGCSHNNSDGEYMAGQLAAYGYKITGNTS
ncbi:CDKAL methylthiotransferase, partial [Alcedo cyanopectus]|nr:CDKAL methylthiotransferase [Ceyx cyanopectus]